jgi:uroporphyrinogen-III synthase
MRNNDVPINVLVTRPAHQSSELCALLSAHGYQPICYPTIEIQALEETAAATQKLSHCGDIDYLIFVSANAVTSANTLLNNAWPATHAGIVAIGPKTAKSLRFIGLKPDIIATQPFDSEGLLAQLPTQLHSLRCLIIKGEGGRTALAKGLLQRGMQVDSVDVYKRGLAQNSPTLLEQSIHYITITSQLALDNLFLLLSGKAAELKQHSIFVVFSQRIADHAKSLGCQHILISSEASDNALLTCINNSNKSVCF